MIKNEKLNSEKQRKFENRESQKKFKAAMAVAECKQIQVWVHKDKINDFRNFVNWYETKKPQEKGTAIIYQKIHSKTLDDIKNKKEITDAVTNSLGNLFERFQDRNLPLQVFFDIKGIIEMLREQKE
jgi:hypothetical protein